jgi:quercetin dioxygenase-like cupin family protein
MRHGRIFAGITTASMMALAAGTSVARAADQDIPADSKCQPIAQRTGEVGCWIIVDAGAGVFSSAPIFWHIESFSTRAAAEKEKGPSGAVVESFGKVWLFTIGPAAWRPASGTHVATIGPLPIAAGREYSAMYMETVTPSGFDSAIHTHSGPEAWYMLEGSMCLETPRGVIRANGGDSAYVGGDIPMLLSATGPTTRRALVLVLHDSTRPPITIEHSWQPKDLCKASRR